MPEQVDSSELDGMSVAEGGRKTVFAVLAGIILAWSSMLYFITPNQLISLLGIGNSYVVIFVACFIGGISLFVPFPYYVVVLTMGAAGLPPLYVGTVAGIGVALGDSVSYLLAYYGRAVVPAWMKDHVCDLHDWLIEQPHWMLYGVFFAYAGFVPLSNEMIMLPTGLAHYPYYRLVLPIMLGSIVFNTLLATMGLYGYTMFF